MIVQRPELQIQAVRHVHGRFPGALALALSAQGQCHLRQATVRPASASTLSLRMGAFPENCFIFSVALR